MESKITPLELLMTYGWAIIVPILVVIALFLVKDRAV